MRILLDKVRERPFRWDETRELSPQELGAPELLELGPVSWRGEVSYAPPGFLLEAGVRYDQRLSCDRCLEPFLEQVEGDLQLLILVRANTPRDLELREEDLGVLVVEDETVEVDPLLFEQVQLNIPMKPLCRPDCAGLCWVCGADLNRERCSCQRGAVDPRWEALSQLRPGGS